MDILSHDNNLSDIKREFTVHLVNMLKYHIYSRFESLFETACSQYKELKKINDKLTSTIVFQNLLSEIANWNKDTIISCCLQLKDSVGRGEVFDKLIRAIIKVNIMIFSCSNTTTLMKKQIWDTIEISHFVHLCFIYSGKRIYYEPYVFSECFNEIEKHNSKLKIIQFIQNGICDAIWHVLPQNDLLDEFLSSKYGINTAVIDLKNQFGGTNQLTKLSQLLQENKQLAQQPLLPQQQIYSLTQQSLSPLPQQSLPPLPQQSLPPLPQQSLPPLPQQSLPPLPQQSLPPFPQQSLPPFPQQSLPPFPQQSLPPLPQQSLPPLPQQSTIHSSLQHLASYDTALHNSDNKTNSGKNTLHSYHLPNFSDKKKNGNINKEKTVSINDVMKSKNNLNSFHSRKQIQSENSITIPKGGASDNEDDDSSDSDGNNVEIERYGN